MLFKAILDIIPR